MSISYNPSIVTNGLVLCLDAANTKSYPGSGTIWSDLSGFGNNGTLYNTPVYSSGSLAFNGTTQYCLCGNAIQVSGSLPWSVVGWFKRTSAYAGKASWGFGTANANFNTFNNASANEISIDLYGVATFSSGQIYDLNSWNFAAWTFSGGVFNRANIKIWKNTTSYTGPTLNILRGAETTTPNINAAGGFLVGRVSAADNAYYAPVTVSHISFYNRAITAAEVAQNFNATKSRYGL
jgi:hypothetical protein